MSQPEHSEDTQTVPSASRPMVLPLDWHKLTPEEKLDYVRFRVQQLATDAAALAAAAELE